MPIPNQPTLPAEGVYTDLEKLFIAEQPQNLWPTNQNSNFGLIRSIICAQAQKVVDKLTELYNELFIDTANGYLSVWENELNVPLGTGFSTEHRRSVLASHRQIAPFTKTRRRIAVERFIQDTFGSAIQLTPAGVSMTVGGVPLQSDPADVTTLYRIYEDVRNFTWRVLISTSTTPDMVGLLRELKHINPAGLTLILSQVAEILDYTYMMTDTQPSGWWRLGANFNDSSGNGFNATGNGGVAAGSAATIINAAVAGGDTATLFDGTNDYLSVATDSRWNTDVFSWEAWIKPAAGAGGVATIMSTRKGSDSTGVALFRVMPSGMVQLWNHGGLIGNVGTVADGVSAHIGISYNGTSYRTYLNGVLTNTYTHALVKGANPLYIGADNDSGAAASWWKGNLDEVATHDRFLEPEEFLAHYKTGIHVP